MLLGGAQFKSWPGNRPSWLIPCRLCYYLQANATINILSLHETHTLTGRLLLCETAVIFSRSVFFGDEAISESELGDSVSDIVSFMKQIWRFIPSGDKRHYFCKTYRHRTHNFHEHYSIRIHCFSVHYSNSTQSFKIHPVHKQNSN